MPIITMNSLSARFLLRDIHRAISREYQSLHIEKLSGASYTREHRMSFMGIEVREGDREQPGFHRRSLHRGRFRIVPCEPSFRRGGMGDEFSA